jgi:hypothetical protein
MFVQKVTFYIEGVLNASVDNKRLDELKIIQDIFNSSDTSNDDFMSYIADIFAGSIQYGGRTTMCELLASIKESS